MVPRWLHRLAGHIPAPVKALIPLSLKRRYHATRPGRAGGDYLIYMDVVGACSLRCPSCPVGNSPELVPKGAMSEDLFRRIVQKVRAEYAVSWIGLFNWTEPFLHPKLPELIAIASANGLACRLSSNLNSIYRLEEVLRAGPQELVISLSGFTQEIYCQTHSGGRIDRVKEHMVQLAALKRRTGARTEVVVYYHKYKHNLHELEPMKRFAAELGFGWRECWAVYMPVEGALGYLSGTLEERNRAFIDQYLAVPLARAVAETAPYRGENCRLLSNMLVMDHNGDVQLCCATYSPKVHTVGNFLQSTPDQLQLARQKHPTCGACGSAGLHVYYRYYDHPQLSVRYQQLAQAETAQAQIQA